MRIKVGKQFLKIQAEPPFEVVVDGQIHPGGVFDRFQQAVEVRQQLQSEFLSKSSQIYPRKILPAFHFAAVGSDRRRYPPGARVHLIYRLEKGVEYQQRLVLNHHQTLWQRSLQAQTEWHVECLEGLEVGNYAAQLLQAEQVSTACFRVLPLGPARPPSIPHQMIHHYEDKVWSRRPQSPDDPFYSFDFSALQDHCGVEIVTEAVLEYHEHGVLCETLEGPDKRVPYGYFAEYGHYVERALYLRLGDQRRQIGAEDGSRPHYLGGDHFAGKVAWPGARPVDGLYFSGSCPAVPEHQIQGPWTLGYSLEGDRESFQIHPPDPVVLHIRPGDGELELESPLAGQALLVLSDPESAGASLRQPYVQTLLSWLQAAASRCHDGPLEEIELEASGNDLFLTSRGQPLAASFSWTDDLDGLSSHSEPVVQQAVRVVDLAASTPVRVPMPARAPGKARLYQFAAGRLLMQEVQWAG